MLLRKRAKIMVTHVLNASQQDPIEKYTEVIHEGDAEKYEDDEQGNIEKIRKFTFREIKNLTEAKCSGASDSNWIDYDVPLLNDEVMKKLLAEELECTPDEITINWSKP